MVAVIAALSSLAAAALAGRWAVRGRGRLPSRMPRRVSQVVGAAPGAARKAKRRRPTGSRWPRLRLRAAAVVAAAAVTTWVAPLAVPVVVGAVLLLPAARARRAVRQRDRAEINEVPELAALLGMATDAGLTIGDAVDVVGHRLTGGVARELRTVRSEVAIGRRLADALAAGADRAGPSGRALLAMLADGVRSGAPIGSALQRMAADGRETRRRQAESAARRLPVKLLFPLVGCVLPAFALLTVVPVVAGALRSLRH